MEKVLLAGVHLPEQMDFEEELEEMKQKKLAYGMDKMLEVFLNENISEYFFYKGNGKWVEELK